MKNIKRILNYLKKYKLYAILAPVLIILEVIMELFLPNIMSNIIKVGVANTNIKYIIINVAFMFLLTIVGVLGGLGSSYFASKASENVAADLRSDVFKKITNLSFLNLEKIKPGHLLTVLTNDINTIGSLLLMGLRILFRVPVIFIGSLIMAFFISPKLTLILVILIPIVFILVFLILRKAFPYFNKMQDCVDEVNSSIRENVSGIRVVKSFVMEETEINKFDRINKKLLDTTLKGEKIITISMPTMMLFINIATILVLWFGGNLVVVNELEVGDIVAFTQYTANILSSILMASMTIMMVSRSVVSANRIIEIMDAKEDFKNNGVKFDIKGKIEFKDVSFSYEGGSGDQVLSDISFVINPLEKVAIIGAIGSGKSTIVKLIPRFYDVTKGSILIDDVNVKDIDVSYLRNSIGNAFQQNFIFSKSIKDNINYGNDKVPFEDTLMAADISQATNFIMEKPKDFDYLLEQRGANLSGGQKQRIAIARAVLIEPKILILDDATSAIDLETAKEIRKSLSNNRKCTTIFITSKIAEALEADRVMVIDDGKLVGFDTPSKLLKNNAYYKDIYYSQLKGDIHEKK
ncbi:MAG: ABC transporter ATP-binding protein/permease [Erysipelotrichaceae bacterium]|nr:ABC transporter ATP-binding protein/permease [Erysipelotrichaceae bacterium]